MQITLTPMRMDATLTLHRAGDILTVNGQVLDLSGVTEGAPLPRAALECLWLASDITRRAARLHLALILPHGPVAPQDTLFPAVLHLTRDGPVSLPPHQSIPAADALSEPDLLPQDPDMATRGVLPPDL